MELTKVFAMPVVALVLGFLLNLSLTSRQAQDNRIRLYTEMMGKREESESNLRKDMFNSILGTFLKVGEKEPPEQHLRREVLNLELLASNFDESLDLGPVFQQVRRELDRQRNADPELVKELDGRLERVAMDVKERQLATLAETGAVAKSDFDLTADLSLGSGLWNFDKYTVPLPSGTRRVAATLCMPLLSESGKMHYRQFQLTMLDFSNDRREVEVYLAVSRPFEEQEKGSCDKIQDAAVEAANMEAEAQFWVGLFAFPMIDNTRLSQSERCTVAIRFPHPGSGELKVAYFRASRASLKDRLYFDEMLHDLVRDPKAINTKEP